MKRRKPTLKPKRKLKRKLKQHPSRPAEQVLTHVEMEPVSTVEVQGETTDLASNVETPVAIENSAGPVDLRDEAEDSGSSVEIQGETEDLESIFEIQVEIENSAGSVELREETLGSVSAVEVQAETEDLASTVETQVEIENSANPAEIRDAPGNPTGPLESYDGTEIPTIPVGIPAIPEKSNRRRSARSSSVCLHGCH